jgi:hypothetical protein
MMNSSIIMKLKIQLDLGLKQIKKGISNKFDMKNTF